MRHSYLFFALLGSLAAAWTRTAAGQGQGQKGRQIEDMEIEILRDRRVTLPEMRRSFDKIPPRAVLPVRTPQAYRLKELPFTPPSYRLSIRPMRLKKEPIQRTTGNFLSAGFGNYVSPYLEASLTSKRSKEWFYGASLHHLGSVLGPVDDENSGAFDTRVRLFGNRYGPRLNGGVKVDYTNRVGYFYGYAPGATVDRDTLMQAYNTVSAEGVFSNTQKETFNFVAKGGFSRLSDRYRARENVFSFLFDSDYSLDKEKKILLSARYRFIDRQGAKADAEPRHLFTFAPAFRFRPLDGLWLTAGFNMIVENDTLQSEGFHLYPHVDLRYRLTPKIEAYTSLSGDFDNVSLHTLSAENLWLNADQPAFHTQRDFEFLIGARGRLGKRLTFDGGFGRVDLKGLYLYRNAPSDRAKFDVVYDDVERLNLFVEIGYERHKKIALGLRGDYFSYTARNETEPWHKPAYRIAFTSSFDLYKKITASMNFFAQGGMYAVSYAPVRTVQLDAALDLSLRVNYFLSEQFSFFIKLDNILARAYPIYFHYPSKGFQLLAGASWSF